ncbi:MAG: glutamate synthase-related protein [Pyrinomonadaceae bacterium]
MEFADSIGMPLRDGLSFAVDTLRGHDLKKGHRNNASGKVFNGFHIARLIAIGADMVNVARDDACDRLHTGSARNLNTRLTGVVTQDERLTGGLNVQDKSAPRRNLMRRP